MNTAVLVLILFSVFLLPVAIVSLQAHTNGKQRSYEYRGALEKSILYSLFGSAFLAILTTLGIFFSLIFESLQFFRQVSFSDFLFGMHWNPQIAMHADQVVANSAFGAIPVFAGTMLITAVALSVSVPVGLLSAIYLAEFATHKQRQIIKPLLEILAGIPTVVYGFFAALFVAPIIKGFGDSLGLNVASESALAAGLVMGVMMIPFISSLSDDVIYAVPQSLKTGSLALGATEAETILRITLPAALPGLVGAFLLALSRALGETMIVVMAAGMSANLTLNPLERVTTVTVQIVAALVGDQEFNNPKTLSAFALGLTLFVVTMFFNILSTLFVKRFRNVYE